MKREWVLAMNQVERDKVVERMQKSQVLAIADKPIDPVEGGIT